MGEKKREVRKNKPAQIDPPKSAKEFRTKIKTDAVMRHVRDSYIGRFTDNNPMQKARRLASEVLYGELLSFAVDNNISKASCPAASHFRDATINLSMATVDFCKKYIASEIDPALALSLTSGYLPLPYDDHEMKSLKKGRWYLLKRSHTQAGQYSFSCLDIETDRHYSGLGCIWKYEFQKKTESALNTAGGFISRNHDQYIFIGAERYIPHNGPSTYQGTQIISVHQRRDAIKLSGISLTATNGDRDPCAAKIDLYYVPESTDEHTGLCTEQNVKQIARKVGIDAELFDFPGNEPCSDWKLLVAD